MFVCTYITRLKEGYQDDNRLHYEPVTSGIGYYTWGENTEGDRKFDFCCSNEAQDTLFDRSHDLVLVCLPFMPLTMSTSAQNVWTGETLLSYPRSLSLSVETRRG